MAKLAKRFSDALAAGRAARDGVQGQKTSKRSNQKCVLVVVFDHTVADVQKIVADISNSQKRNTKIVLVTDRSEILLYQLEGCVTEYFAPPNVLADQNSERAAQLYLQQRMKILIQKWRPIDMLAFGELAVALIETEKLKAAV